MNKDLVLGAGTLALAIVYYLLADAIPGSLLADAVGASGLPRAYAVVLGGLALVLIAKSWRARSTQAPGPHKPGPHASGTSEPGTGTALLRPAGLLAIGIVYVVLVPYLGYGVAIALLIAATAVYQGAAMRQAAVVAVSGAAIFWLLFVVLLRIPHPRGFWPSLF